MVRFPDDSGDEDLITAQNNCCNFWMVPLALSEDGLFHVALFGWLAANLGLCLYVRVLIPR